MYLQIRDLLQILLFYILPADQTNDSHLFTRIKGTTDLVTQTH